MAAFSSRIGLSLGLQNDVVPSVRSRKNSMTATANIRTLTCSKKVTTITITSTSYFMCNKRKQRFVVVMNSTLNSESEPQPGVEVVTIDGDGGTVGKDFGVLEANSVHVTNNVSGGGDVLHGNNPNGKFSAAGGGGGGGGRGGEGGRSGGGGGGGGGDDEGSDKEEEEFGPIMKFEEVINETEARGATLPTDMLEAAKSVGIRKVLLLRCLVSMLSLVGQPERAVEQGCMRVERCNLVDGSAWPLGFATKSCAMLRNRMLADPSFLFKIGTEIVIDSCCATLAEVQKRGKDFWTEFELYLADLLVGVVVNVALVGMLAPYARIGQPSLSKGVLGRMQHAYAALPSSVFEAERPGCRFSVKQRIATYFFKGVMYCSVGFACGLIGQGIANLIMTAKRSISKSEEDIPVPPLLKSAALWGVFLAVSSNTRYQIINGLEQLVESSPLAKQIPPLAMAFTVGVRFGNNIYGGMQFVDWARLSGVQ